MDSTRIEISLGEIELHRGRVRTVLPFVNSGPYASGRLYPPMNGIDTNASFEFVTSAFIPRSGDTLSFFRKVWLQQWSDAPWEDPPCGLIEVAPINWWAAKNEIRDTTITRVILEDVSDPTLAAVIDHVILYPNPNSIWVQHSGTAEEYYEHRRSIPSRLWGKRVRLRFELERRGAVRVPVRTKYFSMQYALSMFETPWSISKMTYSQSEAMNARHVALVSEYLHHVWSRVDDPLIINNFSVAGDTVQRVANLYYKDSIDSKGIKRIVYVGKGKPSNRVTYNVRDAWKRSLGRNATSMASSMLIKPNNTTTLTIGQVTCNYSHGVVNVNIDAPPSTSEFEWVLKDEQGAELRSGLIWPEFAGGGTISIPYLPRTVAKATLKLTAHPSGAMTAKEIDL